MKKRNGVILAIIGYIIFFFCMEGWGANWKVIRKHSVGNVWIDVASISRKPNGIVGAWLKITYSEKGVTDLVKQMGEEYKDLSHSMLLAEYRCTAKESRMLSLTHYSLDGRIIFTENSLGEWNFIIPDSMAEAAFREVCKQPK